MENQENPRPQVDNYVDPAYFGENQAYYSDQYAQFKRSNKASFNWAAFFFQGWWFLYRKLYVPALIFWLVSYIPGVGLIAAVISGFIANDVYFRDAESKLAVGDRSYAGVHSWVIWLAIGIHLAALVVMFLGFVLFFFSAMTSAVIGS